MGILQWLLQTDSGAVGLILRIALAVVMFPHGAQKVLGWFGGHGFKVSMKSFTGSGIPAILALLAIAAEFLGSSRPCCRVSDAGCGLRHRVRDARRYRCSSLATRLFHELVR
jgi:putative oxidoreductase